MPQQSIFRSFTTRPHTQDVTEASLTFLSVVQMNFSTATWILIGASLQAATVYIFSNKHYVLLASTIALSVKLGRTFLQASNILPNPYMQGVIPGRTTALLLNEDGELDEKSGKKVAVLHLGAKSNHPFGLFAPQFGEVGKWLGMMNAEMDSGKVKGFLGQTTFNRRDQRGVPELCLISYWESVEDLWAFAHSETHRDCWQWWEKTIKQNDCVAINHEIFEADARHWENVYVNFQPTLQGATTVVRKGKTFEQGVISTEWVSPLVDAKRGKLARSSGRLGREVSMFDANRVAKEIYDC